MTQIIHQQEASSGSGWLGTAAATAFLVSLLNHRDLSDSDRRWISQRIDTLRSEDDTSDTPALMPAVKSVVSFSYTGLDGPIVAGQTASVSVSAQSGAGPRVAPECTLPGAEVTQHEASTIVSWTPVSASAQLLSCTAAGRTERRLVRASDRKAS